MKIRIEWMEDSIDCETCGFSWASGAVVYFDGVEVIDLTPSASCFGGAHHPESEVYAAILARLGHEVEAEHVSLSDAEPDEEDAHSLPGQPGSGEG